MNPAPPAPAELVAWGAPSTSWPAFLLLVLAATLVSLGLRRLATAGPDPRVLRWLPAAQVGVWALTLLVIVTVLARQGFTTTLALLLVMLVGLFVAASTLLRSVLAGMVIAGEARLHVGDVISLGELRGEVVGLGVRAMQLRDAEGTLHEIPLAEVLARPLTRHPAGGQARCEIELELPEALPVERALERVQRLASLTPYISPRQGPEVFLVNAGGPGEPMRVRVRAQVASEDLVEHFKSDLVRRHRQAFARPTSPAGPVV
ncbi:hypothetical protein DL240_02280 [Lujinxingia litoralis]|uniref:Mechanosensitive ion channel MscS domain-containing protein n=1 Tax=Lujinxingia litoralis TaxID=2211119 RepID=A0A328CAB6_9DELT|nr:mechanosensitive ion channel domain-containing protein [Lujinxingia litoralis]RAL25062.1 hypothetical protein DL240_02280 [Lujinxingia litoralis]